MSKCVKYSRHFLNRLLQTLRDNHNKKSFKLNEDFQKDIKWFDWFLDTFKGVSTNITQHTIYLDACLDGMGCMFHEKVYHCKTPTFLVEEHITAQEMFNIFIVIQRFGNLLKNKTVTIFCDNLAVVTILRTGKTRDMLLAKISRNIFMQAATLDLFLKFTHIAGIENTVADTLSRWQGTPANEKVLKQLPYPVQWVKFLPSHCTLNENI